MKRSAKARKQRRKKAASSANKKVERPAKAKGNPVSGIRETQEARALLEEQLGSLYWWAFNAFKMRGFLNAKALDRSQQENVKSNITAPDRERWRDSKVNKTIFDIGCHRGEDTGYYLYLGYDVVAVDASPDMVEAVTSMFENEIQAGRLVILNYAITASDNETIELNVSEQSLWTSLRPEVASRLNSGKHQITVQTLRLDTLISTYGTPHYCKVDIEGYDAVAVDALKTVQPLPVYISVETECIGEHEIINDQQALETLVRLHEAGYHHFKLVDQSSLTVLSEKPFYGTEKQKGRAEHLMNLKKKHKYDFPLSATGPFGPDLEGEWVDYSFARELLLLHRRSFFEQPNVTNFSFWCDWHATV